MVKFDGTCAYKLIYVFSMPYETHKGLLKVGETTLKTNSKPENIKPNCHELNAVAKKRIDEYTKTAGVSYKLEYTELAIMRDPVSGKQIAFGDNEVHKVLKNSNIQNVSPKGGKDREWFRANIETVKSAISCVKRGKHSLSSDMVTRQKEAIVFRKEQMDAIEKTITVFKRDTEMLWYAKMRFGKTLTALEVIRRSQFRRVIIVTHRPVVDDGWSEDFRKIFFPGNSVNVYSYERKTQDASYTFDEKIDLENDRKIKQLDNEKKHFIYFASFQDLRGSQIVGGKFNKNNAVYAIDWDLIVIDEAHEGTQTRLGDNVIKALRKENSKILALSGTPFNLLDQYSEDNVFTWDYVMEQRSKTEWSGKNFGSHNPYADLPKMHIYTYDLGNKLKKYVFDEYGSKAFNFREFFRVWQENKGKELPNYAVQGKFVHEEDIIAFLDMMVKEDDESGYPFSTQEYREMFRHTLWMVPGVKEAKAFSELLKAHPVFRNFGIANVAGEGDDYEEAHPRDALDLVRKTIEKNDYSITLSCGKLTTGVTVKEWTAVLMLSGSYSTVATQYMQTIFRVQSAGTIDGKQKTDCFVFDFAPDRTLRVLTQTVHLSRKPGKSKDKNREAMTEFLNYCPVISIVGSQTREYSVNSMMEQIKQIYAERAVNSGFEDESLYNDELLKLNELDAKKFNELKNIIGVSKATRVKQDVVVNGQGLTDAQIEYLDGQESTLSTNTLSKEELELRQRLKEAKNARKKAIEILRGISIRMPLLIYGADIPLKEDIGLDDFVKIIDDNSWNEFMPTGVTKQHFNEFIKYYDRDVFIAAGKRIRKLVAMADREPPTKRVIQIAEIFRHFKNPDKETVLTPWRVVNLHMSQTIGGWCFFNERFEDDTQEKKNRLAAPRFVDQGEVTSKVFAKSSHILEINSKTGLYPLYVSYSFYRQCIKNLDEQKDPEICQAEWNRVVRDNVFVICKTPMAKAITKRTLCGYRDIPCNAHYFEDLVNMLKNKPKQFKERVLKGSYWKKEVKNMNFDAVVGNPPYQENIDNRGEQPPIYHKFYDVAFQLSDIVTLITPGRFLFNVGKTPQEWNNKMLNDEHFKVVSYFIDSREVFPSVDIKGGVAITLRNANENFGKIGIYIHNETLKSIRDKVCRLNSCSINTIMYTNTSYKYSSLFFEENPDFASRVSGGSKRYLSSSVFDKFPEVFYEEEPRDGRCYAKIIGRQNNKRKIYYFKEDYLNPPDNYRKYKVFLPSSNGSGAIGEVFSTPVMGTPVMGNTETFISFGCFDDQEQAENLLSYLKTKFARTMLGTKKVTQGNKKPETWINVPLQDFTKKSDIDWTKPIHEIDQQLYKKYGLSTEEIDFIETKVKSMETAKDSE